jgi:hypothetical protein
MFPKKGNEFPRPAANLGGLDFEEAIAAALVSELGLSHRAVKTVMRWTGANERTVKHWFAGTHAPNGQHLISLARHSDAVVVYFLLAAGRPTLSIGIRLIAVRGQLTELVETIDRCTVRH